MKLLIITQKVDKDDQLLGFFIDWIARFAQKFEKVTVLCLEKGEFNLSPNVKVLSLGKDRGASKLRQFFNFQFSIFNLSKDYDAVFVHMNPIWVVLGGWCWRLMQKKIFFWYTSGGITAKLKLAEKFANTIFTASSESFRLPSKKVVVIGHGIDTELFKPGFSRSKAIPAEVPRHEPSPSNLKDEASRFDLGEIKILSVGRIAPVKNYEVLIDAIKMLKDKGFNFSVTMVGEAPLERDKNYEENLKSKIKSLKLVDNFNFVGKINHKDLPAYYQSHDLFIHLSKTGSLDKAILEAMACGMNVLSSSDSARSFLPTELIFNGNNFLELAEKIEKTSNRNLGEQLRQFVVENHNLDKLIDKIVGLINK
ncbi:MAG: glycosyltransferase family 4 protein [bacterium]|nr:glycosyltransferase family 4 protein [bacterium]